MTFRDSVRFGKAGESLIARWLRAQSWTVLPVYEKIIDEGKGPHLFLPSRELIAPDLLAWIAKGTVWIEAKHKTAFSWHRRTQKWVTGVDLPHYEDYCRVDDSTPFPVWLLFLHRGGQAKDSPPNSPKGLFGNTLAELRQHESHRDPRGSYRGMVYWALEFLKPLASLDEVTCASPGDVFAQHCFVAAVHYRTRADGNLMLPV